MKKLSQRETSIALIVIGITLLLTSLTLEMFAKPTCTGYCQNSFIKIKKAKSHSRGTVFIR